MPGRILIYGLNYAPEFVGVGKYTAELAEWLAGRGHQIRVICAPPYYPNWGVQKPYRACAYQREQLKGVDVWRCPLWVPKKPHGINRILHLLSFAISSLWPLLRSVFWKPDCVLLILPTLICAPAVILFSRMRGCRSWVHVQDFEIEAAAGLGITRRNVLFRLLIRLEGHLYRCFDRASSISDRMLQRLADKGMPTGRIHAFPNWVDCDAIYPTHSVDEMRQELSLDARDFVALFAGTLNYKQNIEVIIEAARLLRDRAGLRFLICGAGPESDQLQWMARDLSNVLWLKPQPPEHLPALLCLANVHLLPQRPGVSDLVLPSKLGGMLASGRPVVAMADAGTEIAGFVMRCGIVVPPSDHRALARALVDLADDPISSQRLGAMARRYAESNLNKEAILSRFQNELMQLIRTGMSKPL